MITSQLQIFNLALNAVGTRSNLTSVDENTREAEVCRLWYSVVLDQMLAAAHWGSARSHARLALITERDYSADWVASDPAPEYTYMYGVPTDMLTPRYLAGYQRFEIGVYAGQKVLMTNVENAVLVYTSRQDNVALWSATMQMAMPYALAGHIAMPLHAKAARARGAIEQANALILAAREEESNSSDNMVETIPEWIAARGYAVPASTTRYVYPYGRLFSVGDANV